MPDRDIYPTQLNYVNQKLSVNVHSSIAQIAKKHNHQMISG